MLASRRSALKDVSADGTTHAGLWFDAMLAALPEKRSGQGADRDEDDAGLFREHLKSLTGRSVPAGYREAATARERALRLWPGSVEASVTRVFDAKALGRMVVGLGAASLVETNVALQRTWGVPYLSGSALKGLASSTAHRSGDPAWKRAETDAEGGEHARVLFGDTTTAGVVTFHDAWWVPTGSTLPIDLDVMTVHHADYYMKQAVPADWDAPNPVAFVTTHGTYLVALTGPDAWVSLAASWLKLGLARDGIGAKTRAGYGRMSLEPKRSPEELIAKAAEDTVRGISARYQGAGNRREIVTRLLDARAKGVDQAVLDVECKALYANGTSSWKDWLKDAGRTNDERALFAGVAGGPRDSNVPVRDSGVPVRDSNVSVLPWTAAQGWIAREMNRETLFVRSNAKLLKRQVKDVVFGDGEREALALASEERPVDLEVQVKGTDKVVGARRRKGVS